MKTPAPVWLRKLLLALTLLAGAPPGCGVPAPADPPGSTHVATGVSYTLEDGEQYHREAPETFEIPSRAAREALHPDQIVKLMFDIQVNGVSQVERMWVVVERIDGSGYVGVLDNQPVATQLMRPGLRIHFEPRHVINIYSEKPDPGK
jgi:hypothetical protein